MKSIPILNVFLCIFVSCFCFALTPPSNNSPATATTLSVGSGSCGTKTSGTTVGATNSGETIPTCGDNLDSDVWYKVTVPDSGNIAIETYSAVVHGASTFNSVLAIYSGTPESLSAVTCDDDGSSNISGFDSKIVLLNLNSGSTLYVRLLGNNGQQDTFEICAWDPSVPTNNTPVNAIELTLGSDSCDDKKRGTTIDGTIFTVEDGDAKCKEVAYADVWYKTTVPASGNMAIQTFSTGPQNTSFNAILAAYSGELTNLKELDCDVNTIGPTAVSKLEFTGLTDGNTLYIRLWGAYSDHTFDICAWEQATLSKSDVTSSAFTVYPNPTKDMLYMEGPSHVHCTGVFSLTGIRQLGVPQSKNNTALDLSGLSAGVYLIRIAHEKGSSYVKFVKE